VTWYYSAAAWIAIETGRLRFLRRPETVRFAASGRWAYPRQRQASVRHKTHVFFGVHKTHVSSADGFFNMTRWAGRSARRNRGGLEKMKTNFPWQSLGATTPKLLQTSFSRRDLLHQHCCLHWNLHRELEPYMYGNFSPVFASPLKPQTQIRLTISRETSEQPVTTEQWQV
jgi:hypothetical protein